MLFVPIYFIIMVVLNTFFFIDLYIHCVIESLGIDINDVLVHETETLTLTLTPFKWNRLSFLKPSFLKDKSEKDSLSFGSEGLIFWVGLHVSHDSDFYEFVLKERAIHNELFCFQVFTNEDWETELDLYKHVFSLSSAGSSRKNTRFYVFTALSTFLLILVLLVNKNF